MHLIGKLGLMTCHNYTDTIFIRTRFIVISAAASKHLTSLSQYTVCSLHYADLFNIDQHHVASIYCERDARCLEEAAWFFRLNSPVADGVHEGTRFTVHTSTRPSILSSRLHLHLSSHVRCMFLYHLDNKRNETE